MQHVLESAKQVGLGYAIYDGAALDCRSASMPLPRPPERSGGQVSGTGAAIPGHYSGLLSTCELVVFGKNDENSHRHVRVGSAQANQDSWKMRAVKSGVHHRCVRVCAHVQCVGCQIWNLERRERTVAVTVSFSTVLSRPQSSWLCLRAAKGVLEPRVWGFGFEIHSLGF